MKEFKAREWQKEAIKRSLNTEHKGIFLEAAGGRGKTLCALQIAKEHNAKKVIVVNNRVNILKGWEKSYKDFGYDNYFELVVLTDKKLSNLVKDGSKLACDVLVLDEWQNISSKNCVSAYNKVRRKYTVGLSATPVRKRGQNFYPLEKTLWGRANPNQKFNWELEHGKMVYDAFSYSKTKWEDFKDFESYVNNLPNFMRFEEIEKIENAEENNGFKTRFFKKTVASANPDALKDFYMYNLVHKNGKTAVAKASFGRKTFERYLQQTGIEIEFPKLVPANADTPMLEEIDGLIKRAPHDMLIITKSVGIAEIIKKRNPSIGIWIGDKKEKFDSKVSVATFQTLGVGIDGLQEKFKTLVVLDPVDKNDGGFDDYRQLLWRITGSRQQHDVNVIEFYFK